MARRRQKKRTHVPDLTKQNPKPGMLANPINTSIASRMSQTPKTMVIRVGAGEVGPSVSSLVRDTRRVLEPYTAARLRERKSNKLKDFTTMAGPLGVTQLLLFSRPSSSSGHINLRILRTPRGPTLHFRVLSCSLCKDIQKSQSSSSSKRSSKSAGNSAKEYLTPPLLVMNNFISTQKDERPINHEVLTTSMFQSMIPAISAQKIPLQSVKRVLLLNRELPTIKDVEGKEDEDYVIDLRHYSISTRPTGVPKAIRRLNRVAGGSTGSGTVGRRGIPNLGKMEDISEFLLDPGAAGGGYTSESELDTDGEGEVEVAVPVLQRAGKASKVKEEGAGGNVEKKAVKLAEIGPRMRLQLVKIEEGANDGKILWHSFVKKTRAEERELDVKAKQKQKLKDERKSVQQANVGKKKEKEEEKKKKLEEKKKKREEREKEGGKDANGDEDMDDDEEDSNLEKETGWSGDEDIWSGDESDKEDGEDDEMDED